MRRVLLVLALCLAGISNAQTVAPAPTELQRKVETFVRKLFAWGPQYEVKVSQPSPSSVPGYLQVNVEVLFQGQSDNAVMYVSTDGRYLLRGDLHDLQVDPFAANRAKLTVEGHPAKGPANARVTLVEFSDFQCPSCRALHQALKTILPKYPQLRVVYKDLPLAQIHPWAVTAAIAGRCAFMQNPANFWKYHDSLFDNQENIRPDNAWERILELATQAGYDPAAMRACMIAPEPKAAVEASVKEAQALRIANTPTVFVNGRRITGGDPATLEQYIAYELAQGQPAPRLTPKAAPPKAPPQP